MEQSLIDGTFDKEMEGKEIPDIPEDLIEVQEFSEAMEDLRREIASWEDDNIEETSEESIREFDTIYADFELDSK